MSDIHLVSMPFGHIQRPSLGVGILVSAAQSAGLDIKSEYPLFDFAKMIGHKSYYLVSELLKPDFLIADWIFSSAAFGENGFFDKHFPDYLLAEDRFTHFIESRYPGKTGFFIKKITDIQKKTESFISQTAEKILADKPRIVGCTTSILQYNSSLALLKKIKDENPDIITMLGGAQCEGEMGWITKQKFHWIDVVVSGEADLLFAPLCSHLLSYGLELTTQQKPKGVFMASDFRNDVEQKIETAIINDLNKVPIPDYSDYMQEMPALDQMNEKFALYTETSRGCWKGCKNPCTFCGLNGQRMHYRVKSTDRIINELSHLAKAYNVCHFIMTDTVLNPRYFDHLFNRLAANPNQITLFFETISNLTEDQMIKLAKAGVRYIQPGIESLHDGFLELLNKGNSAINNIALLKYGIEYDIEIFWNLIYQIPGEKSEYYREMLKLLPLLYHFKPPNLVRIRFDRFSEYYNHPQKYGLDLAPLDRYQYVYPFNPIELDHFAYYFQNKREIQTLKQEKEDLVRSITEWIIYKKQNNLKSALYYIEEKTTSTVYDYRKCAIAQEFKLNSLEHAIYKACRHPITFDAIVSSLFILDGHSPDEDIITKILAKFKKNKILIRIGDQFLALAVKAKNPKDLQLKSYFSDF